MELRSLRYFLEVAREGNMTRAAAVLFVTQPALSRQMKGLEDELGVRLFDRRSHCLQLTEAGRLLVERAEEILALSDRTLADFAAPELAVAGPVHIGVGESFTSRFIAKVAHRVAKRYPHVRFHLHDGNDADLVERFDQGFLDFCVFVQPADLSKYRHVRIPEKDSWGLIVRKDSPLAAKDAVVRSDLMGVPLILSEQPIAGSLASNAFIDWFGDDFDQLNVVGTYNLSYNATLFAAEGLGGVVALQKQLRVDEAEVLRFVPFAPLLEVASDVAWKKHRALSPAAEAFLQALTEELSATTS